MRRLLSILAVSVTSVPGVDRTPASNPLSTANQVTWARHFVNEQVPRGAALQPTAQRANRVLIAAVERGDVNAVAALLAKGADPNEFEVSSIGTIGGVLLISKSPLLLAVEDGNEPMVRLLLSHGARARWRDGNGMTVAEVARRRKSGQKLVDLLSLAEEREFTLVPEWPLPGPLALAALATIAQSHGDATAREQLDRKLLQRVGGIVRVLTTTWPRGVVRPPVLAWSLTRDVNSLEWAIRNRKNETLAAVVAGLETKQQDCLTSPDGAFGEVKISVRTVLGDGTERRGLRIRYIERFYWDLLATVPTLANQWKELAATTLVVAEPLTAGDYIIVARSPDGKDLSEAKPISVSRGGTTQFDVSLR
jgi:hypothetical protein